MHKGSMHNGLYNSGVIDNSILELNTRLWVVGSDAIMLEKIRFKKPSEGFRQTCHRLNVVYSETFCIMHSTVCSELRRCVGPIRAAWLHAFCTGLHRSHQTGSPGPLAIFLCQIAE